MNGTTPAIGSAPPPIVATKRHAMKGKDTRPFTVARRGVT